MLNLLLLSLPLFIFNVLMLPPCAQGWWACEGGRGGPVKGMVMLHCTGALLASLQIII